MTQEYQKLQEKIKQVRQRFRWIVLTRGLVFSLIASMTVVVVAVFLVDRWNYNDRALFLARVFSALFILGIFAWFLVRPLWRRVMDVQIARYIEEHHPILQDRLVSAIELGQKEAPPNPILPLLIRDAIKHSSHIQAKTLFNPREPYLSGSIACGLILFFTLLQILGPDFFQYATLKLYANWLVPQAEPLYRLEVAPGNTQVRKGSDQLISARLMGFDSQEVNLLSRYESSHTWEKTRMESQKSSNSFGFLFLDINEKIHYYVQAGNVKSPEFTLSVTDLAQVEKIDLTYNFPRYSGLPPKKEEDSGEISALKGSRVDVEAFTNVDVATARILLEDGTSIPMERIAEKKLRGRIEVKKDSSYKIELTDLSKSSAIGSHEYPITALEDQPPLVTLLKPGRDKKATKLEEVLTEVKADDDFGINSLELHFTVNGGKESVVNLFQQKTGEIPKSISGTHTFFLEEYNLEPGDFVTYFARASDALSTTTSDIYFLEVRPFGKEYSQAQFAGGAGGAGDVSSVLSARQKEILAATWRLIRDKKGFGPKEYTDNLKLVATSQQKLQQQTKTLSDRIRRRALATRDKEFQKLSENLIKAVEAMTPAHQWLSQDKPRDAVSPEQTALQHLMRAEAYFKEIQVAFGNSSGGQSNSLGAEELEGLFELELDKLKNQYETLQQRNSMQAGEEIDEATRKLKELARRQQQLNERNRQMPMSQFASGGGSGGSDQQSLQAEAEKLARQLERLSRETQSEELLKASQRLKQAAQEMRNNSSRSSGNASQNRGLQALSRLNDAQQLLDSHQKNGLSDDLRRMQADAEQLARQQEKIQSGLEELARNSSENGAKPSTPANSDQAEKDFNRKRQIFQDKTQLKKGLDAMEQSLFASARRVGNRQKATSQKLQSAGNAVHDNRIQEKVDQAGQMIARGLLDSARQREQNIQAMLEDLKQKIASAGKSLDNSASATTEDRLSKALSQTGDLIGNLDSLNRRLQQFHGAKSQKSSPSEQQPTDKGLSDANNPQPNGKEGRRGKSTGPGEQSKEGSTPSMNSEDQPGQQAGQSPGNGKSPDGKGASKSSQTTQANPNSNSSALGGNSPQGELHENAISDGEHQYHGSTNLGNAAVNFGDRQLPPPGRLTPEQMRQFEKEYQLRLKEAQEIGRNLTGQPDLATQLKNMVERMKQMSSMKFLLDERELERLRNNVIEGFRQLELDLSKNLQHLITKENLHLAKDEEIPEAYRKQVEDYYKALSKQR